MNGIYSWQHQELYLERNCLQQQVLLLYKHSVLNEKTDFCTLNTLNQSNRDYVRVSEMLRIKHSISALFLMHFHTHTSCLHSWPPLFPPPPFFFFSPPLPFHQRPPVISPLLTRLDQGRFCSPQVRNPRLARQAAAEMTLLSKALWSFNRNFTFLCRFCGIFLPGTCELSPAPQHWRLSLAVEAEWFHCLLWLYQHCTGEGREKETQKGERSCRL